MSSPTTYFALAKPDVGSEADIWGSILNQDLNDIDSILEKLLTLQKGATAPSSPYNPAGALWLDDTNDPVWNLKIYDGSVWNDILSVNKDTHKVVVTAAFAVGQVSLWAGGATLPSGWIKCDGSAISRTTYATLFAVIGTTYGVGDGASTFNVPDLRDRFAMGSGGSYAPGATGGSDGVTLTVNQLPNHTHDVKSGAANYSYSVGYSTGARIGGPGSGSVFCDLLPTTGTISSYGGQSTVDNKPKFQTLTAYMIFSGVI